MGRSRYRIREAGAYFLTCTIVGWQPTFTRPPIVEIIMDSWRFLQEQERSVLYGYVVMENHLHFIASADDLARQIADFKSFTARKVIDHLVRVGDIGMLDMLRLFKVEHKSDRQFQLWQEGSHPELIPSDDIMRQKLEYIHNNPVRRGYVGDPTHWRYSSAGDYMGRPGLVPVRTDWLMHKRS